MDRDHIASIVKKHIVNSIDGAKEHEIDLQKINGRLWCKQFRHCFRCIRCYERVKNKNPTY